MNFGELQGIQVRNADPIFDGASVVILDTKLDKEEVPRPELTLADPTWPACASHLQIGRRNCACSKTIKAAEAKPRRTPLIEKRAGSLSANL